MLPRSRAFTGAVRDNPDSRDYYLDFSIMNTSTDKLPSEFDMYKDNITVRQADGSTSEISPPFKLHVFNQFLDTSTCVCNALGIAYKCLTERQKTADEGFIPSRLFLYYIYRLMYKTDLPHGRAPEQKRSTWLASLANNPPHIEEQIADDKGSSPRDICRILRYLGCCEERSVYEPGAGYPERDMWEPGWKPGPTGFIDGTSWWPYFEIDPPPKGRNLEQYFTDFWWPAYNAVAVDTKRKDEDGEVFEFPAGSLGKKPPSSTAFGSANKHRVLNFSHPGGKDSKDTVPNWKMSLKHGWPVVFMFYVNDAGYGDYEAMKKNGWIAPKTGANFQNYTLIHCVLAVGWSDGKGCFKIQDSYGSDSYEDGFWWMPYEWLEGDSNSSTVIHGNVWTLHE